MKKNNVLIIISLLLMVVPFFIDIYSIWKLISLGIGIILLDISLVERKNIFLLFYLPILLIIFTYALDYIKVYTLKISPIYVIENKINSKVSIYNSYFYRVFDCDGERIFDNNYQKDFACSPDFLEEININKFLNEPSESYKKHKGSFVKIIGKISKITGTNSLLMQEYIEEDGQVNGYVKFNNTSKLKALVNGLDLSNLHIYDYVTIVGYVDGYDKNEGEIVLNNIIIEDSHYYDDYSLQVIESNECNKELKEYIDNVYSYCIENIYLDYNGDKYELSYVIKDKKEDFKNILKKAEQDEMDDYMLYKFEKFNVLACSNKNILMKRNEKINLSLCEE